MVQSHPGPPVYFFIYVAIMEKKLFMITVIPLLIFIGCSPSTVVGATKNDIVNQQKIANALQAGADIKEIDNPHLELPPDIEEGQIKKYFKSDRLLFALPLRRSINVDLSSLPKGFQPTFAGILVADQDDKSWKKLVQIKENNTQISGDNNPYYLWKSDDKLYLSVVDGNGAGSGEGNMHIFVLSTDGQWKLAACYYYNGLSPKTGYDYFSFTSQLDQQITEPCIQNLVTITSFM